MKWRHVKSNELYEIVGQALREHDLEPMMMYKRINQNGPIWLRTVSEFLDGRFLPVDDPVEKPARDVNGELLLAGDYVQIIGRKDTPPTNHIRQVFPDGFIQLDIGTFLGGQTLKIKQSERRVPRS